MLEIRMFCACCSTGDLRLLILRLNYDKNGWYLCVLYLMFLDVVEF